jgi:hypothetical protein
MLNAFCESCAKKPGWDFSHHLVVMRSCMRCMLHRPVNFYVAGKPVAESDAHAAHHGSPAPQPKDLVKSQVNQHAEVNLPKAKGSTVVPPPSTPATASNPVPPGEMTEADKALEAIQPNRPGVKLETKPKSK